ncbi:hypothetical protein B0T25DRAFT_569122 [Lasiosphaeria hispida]|uniref:Uncharacterized protein n=1 Tax=Lasiosphaeria hispida TaxID=260671 RepID=A0AAJ0HK67_9PEZI|nr:hypothetical protein B0T25DRAFT_569122 [Lasiosphaeria hispida]
MGSASQKRPHDDDSISVSTSPQQAPPNLNGRQSLGPPGQTQKKQRTSMTPSQRLPSQQSTAQQSAKAKPTPGLSASQQQRTKSTPAPASRTSLAANTDLEVALLSQQSDHDTTTVLGPPKPSNIVGLPTLISRLPISVCRNVIVALPPRDVRNLLIYLVAQQQQTRAASQLATAYDNLNAPCADRLVAFDALVSTIKTTLEPYERDRNEAPLEDAVETEYLAALRKVLTAPQGVFVNVRLLHSSALTPASFGTKINALRALLQVTMYLITGGLLFMRGQRDLFDEGPTAGAFLTICDSLTEPEKKMAFAQIGQELKLQATEFEKNSVFNDIVDAFCVLERGSKVVVEMQAVPMGPMEGDSDSPEGGDDWNGADVLGY